MPRIALLCFIERLFAPICIGGPSSTSLEKNDAAADASAESAKQSIPSQNGMDGHSGRQLPVRRRQWLNFSLLLWIALAL